jgi:ABC-type dipeptide/oligopeptide/nickel transport system ATPase component
MVAESVDENALPIIAPNDRVAIFGGTGSGKSVLAHVLYRSIPNEGWWKIIIDITDSIHEPEALTFYDPFEIPWDKSYNLRFVPDPSESMDDQISALFLGMYAHGVCWFWLDEANEVSTAHRTAAGLRKVLLQGRKAYVGGSNVTPRPKDISKHIITQAQYIAIFTIVDFDDRSYVAKNIGMSPVEFDDLMSTLEEYEYLFYDVRARTLYRVPAIPADVVDLIENPPIEDEE